MELNRRENHDLEYDLVIGPVADEGMYIVLYRFKEGLISKEQAMEQLRATRLDGVL